MSAESPTTFPVRIWRGDAGGRFEHYDVPRQASQTVLDVVTHVQRHVDPSLAYRYACRVGMCGSCAMTVNGKARWTCRTHVDTVAKSGTLEIGPLTIAIPGVRLALWLGAGIIVAAGFLALHSVRAGQRTEAARSTPHPSRHTLVQPPPT